MRKIAFLVVSSVFIYACAHMATKPDVGEVYQNNHIEHPEKSFWSFVRMRLFGEDEWADHAREAKEVKVQPVNLTNLNMLSVDQITWIGHSTFLIQYNGVTILTDPIFSKRASPLSFAGPKRLVPLPVELDELPPIDVVVISHNHYDHLDEATIKQLGNRPHYYVPEGLKAWFVEQGVKSEQVSELAWWKQAQHSKQLTVVSAPSQHWSARGLNDRNRTHWASWLFKFDDYTLWFAGDTGYNPHDFKDIGNFAGEVDLALIPIGAYAPRHFMKTYHVNVEEAVQIHRDIRAVTSIGMHWGTFPLTAEPVLEPPQRLAKLKSEDPQIGDFRVMTIGQSLSIAPAMVASTKQHAAAVKNM